MKAKIHRVFPPNYIDDGIHELNNYLEDGWIIVDVVIVKGGIETFSDYQLMKIDNLSEQIFFESTLTGKSKFQRRLEEMKNQRKNEE